jgi:hypothetical protein
LSPLLLRLLEGEMRKESQNEKTKTTMIMMDYNNPNEIWRRTGFNPYKRLSKKERQQAGCIHGVLFVVAAVVLIIIAALCQGCTTTKEVVVEKVRTDTVWQNHMQHDSIHVRDSIWVERWMSGDTVYVVKDRWKTEWRERLKTDTVYMSKTDTVYIEKTTENTKTLTWFDRWRVRIGTFIFIVLGLFAVYCGIRFALKMRNKLP